jgi:hypothetical protein
VSESKKSWAPWIFPEDRTEWINYSRHFV